MKRSEHLEQREFVQWFRQSFPGVLIFAIPNGGKRGRAESLRLKVEGVVAGIPDLYVPAWQLWIEMKADDGSVSPDQNMVMAYLDTIGHRCIVAWGKDDAVKQILKFI